VEESKKGQLIIPDEYEQYMMNGRKEAIIIILSVKI